MESRSQPIAVYVEGKLAGGLHGVGVEVDAGFGGDLADLFDGLEDAGLVVGEHDGDELGVGPEGAAHVGGIDEAAAVHGNESHFAATLDPRDARRR